MTHHLFYAEPTALNQATVGSVVSVHGAEARHAVQVMRLAVGEGVDVADGTGRRVVGTIRDAAPEQMSVQVEEIHDDVAASPQLVLVQALAKGDRDLLAIQTATELGIDAVIPWQAERSIVRWKGEKAAKARAKWDAALLAAAKQARRSRIPATREPLTGTAVAELVTAETVVIVLHEDAEDTLGQLFAECLRGETTVEEVVLVVGPEGGISPQELEALTQAGAVAVKMGQHVLRSSTAGPAATAVLQQLLGRW